MTSDELRQISRRHTIVLPRASAPILLNRNYFFADKRFSKLAGLPVKADLVPSLKDGFPEQFVVTAVPVTPARASAESRVRGQLPILPPPPVPILVADEASLAKPGNVFLMNASIAARRAGAGVGPNPLMPSTAAAGFSVPAMVSPALRESSPQVPAHVQTPVAVMQTPIELQLVPGKIVPEPAPLIDDNAIALACLWMVKLRDILPLPLASIIETTAACHRFGNLIQSSWIDIAAMPGLTAPMKRELKRVVKVLGFEWSTPLAPWPPVGPAAFLDALEANGKALAQIALSSTRDTSTAGTKNFKLAQRTAATGVKMLQKKLGADSDGVMTVADVLARAGAA